MSARGYALHSVCPQLSFPSPHSTTLDSALMTRDSNRAEFVTHDSKSTTGDSLFNDSRLELTTRGHCDS